MDFADEESSRRTLRHVEAVRIAFRCQEYHVWRTRVDDVCEGRIQSDERLASHELGFADVFHGRPALAADVRNDAFACSTLDASTAGIARPARGDQSGDREVSERVERRDWN